jgi:hypothetical protein
MSVYNQHAEYAPVVGCWYTINVLFSFLKAYTLATEIVNILCDCKKLR